MVKLYLMMWVYSSIPMIKVNDVIRGHNNSRDVENTNIPEKVVRGISIKNVAQYPWGRRLCNVFRFTILFLIFSKYTVHIRPKRHIRISLLPDA